MQYTRKQDMFFKYLNIDFKHPIGSTDVKILSIILMDVDDKISL